MVVIIYPGNDNRRREKPKSGIKTFRERVVGGHAVKAENEIEVVRSQDLPLVADGPQYCS